MKIIKAKEDMWLTQKNDVPDIERDFIKEICAPDNYDEEWRDATNEEKEEWESRINEESEVEDVQ